MNHFNSAPELSKIRRKYCVYRKRINQGGIEYQNAINNLYSIYIQRELNKLWHAPVTDHSASEKVSTFLQNWYKEIRIFKQSIK